MSSLSTFGAFTTARLGIYASQKALDVVANNITNINTEGYTRQRVDQVSLFTGAADKYRGIYDTRIGNGPLVTGTSQFRDPYLDIRYRNENTRVGTAQEKLDGLEQIADILDEVGDGVTGEGEGILEAQINDLISQVNTLHAQGAGLDEYDTLVRSSAEAICGMFHQYANKLNELKEVQTQEFQNDLDDVNDILLQIRDLNSSIRKAQIYGGDMLEQQDARNLLIDKLSAEININVSYEFEHLGPGFDVEKLVISTTDSDGNQTDLINGIYGAQLEFQQIEPDENGDISEQGQYINDNYFLQITRLETKRGEVYTWKDANDKPCTSEVVKLSDTAITGGLQAQRELLTEMGEFTPGYVIDSLDTGAASKRGIQYYQQALDAAAKMFAQVMNDVNTTYRDADTGKSVDMQELQGLKDSGSATQEQVKLLDELSDKRWGVLFSSVSGEDNPDGITASNICVSDSWSKGTTRIVTDWDPEAGSTANSNLQHMLISLKTGEYDFCANDIKTGAYQGDIPYYHGTIQGMMTNMWETLASDINNTETLLDSYNTIADELYVQRDGISGVDLNDETMNMLQFQKSLNAAYRLLTAIDEELDRLINNTGLAGR